MGSSLAWTSRMAWTEAEVGQGSIWSKKDEKVKVLRMSLPIVENLSGPQESIFNLSRGPQLHFGEKSKNWSNFIKFIDFPPFPLFGVPWAAVILSCIAHSSETPCHSLLKRSVPGGVTRNNSMFC